MVESLSNTTTKKKPVDGLAEAENRPNRPSDDLATTGTSITVAEEIFLDSEVDNVNTVSETCEIQPLHVFSNVHQSGVNCLHVSDIECSQNSVSGVFFSVISGGDDQALHCLCFEVPQSSISEDSEIFSENLEKSTHLNQFGAGNCRIRLVHHDKVLSAHCSAIKGVWTDSKWVFTTGLDQRIRCWYLKEHCKLTEYTNLIVSVPEPEALHAIACERDRYEIVVAGRGMQMVNFVAS